jgi:RNA polymerase sigma factor (sigma-70 family)
MNGANWNDQQERQCIENARNGDLSAFNQMVIAYQDPAFRVALWMLNDEAIAEDIVQSVFLSAYRGIKHFRSQSIRAWLLKMVRNACIDEIRRQKRHPWVALEPKNADSDEVESARWCIDTHPSPEESVIKLETAQKINQALHQLPDGMCEVVVLIDVEEVDYQEAAVILGLPLGTIKSRLARARARLRQILWDLTNEGSQERPPTLIQACSREAPAVHGFSSHRTQAPVQR